jgi:HSP20 family protein
MASFFEKLKKGMGIEEMEELAEEKEEKPGPVKSVAKKHRPAETMATPKKTIAKKTLEEKRKIEIATSPIEEEPKIEEKEGVGEEIKEEISQVSEKKEKRPGLGLSGEPEGQLAIDVYQTDKYLVIQSAIAGIDPKNLDISFEREVITIRGRRDKQFEEEGDYFTKECFWGPFSREVILPVEIDPDRAEATIKEGILTIRAPKILKEKKRKISIKNI